MCHLFRNFRCDFCGKMYTASGSLRLHLKSHLSRLAANAFGSINNIPGFNISEDPLHIGQNDFKFGIKQEVFEQNEAREDAEGRLNQSEVPKSNDERTCESNFVSQSPKQEN